MKTDNRLAGVCGDFSDRMMEEYDLPGLAVGVIHGDEEYHAARGFRNFVTKAPMKENDIFHCASVSKLFTSAGILELAEDGKLSLEDRLVDILPELSIADGRCENVTIRQMLTHTSGIGDVADYCWDTPRTDESALKDYVMSEEVHDTPLLWEPGKGGFRYSNMAYEILGSGSCVHRRCTIRHS